MLIFVHFIYIIIKRKEDENEIYEPVKYNRTSKTAKLYSEVYGNYEDLDYFPIADNTNEIDMSKLKEIVEIENKINVKNLTFLLKFHLSKGPYQDII